MGSTPDPPKNENDNPDEMTPDKYRDLLETKANLETQITNLTSQNTYLQQQLNIFQCNNYTLKGNLNNLQNTSNMNLNQAIQQIQILNNQNSQLMTQNYNLQQQLNFSNVEIDKLKFYCNKMQLMLLNNMQKISMNDNINSWQKMNTLNNNMNNNFNNLNNTPNFNFQQANNSKTIIFNVNNKMKCPIATLPNHKLGNIFILALYQNGYSNFVDIQKFSFRYNANNISSFFYQNKEVRELQCLSGNFPIIEVSGF